MIWLQYVVRGLVQHVGDIQRMCPGSAATSIGKEEGWHAGVVMQHNTSVLKLKKVTVAASIKSLLVHAYR